MGNVTISLSPEDHERLSQIALTQKRTEYAIAKEAILERLQEFEDKTPGATVPSEIVLAMVDALRLRKWHLYQIEDYSDRNHKTWLEGRFRKASRSEILDAIALFRSGAKS